MSVLLERKACHLERGPSRRLIAAQIVGVRKEFPEKMEEFGGVYRAQSARGSNASAAWTLLSCERYPRALSCGIMKTLWTLLCYGAAASAACAQSAPASKDAPLDTRYLRDHAET